MTTADTDARRERVDVAMIVIVESTFVNQIERAPDGVRGPAPTRETRSDFGTASQTGPEAGGVGRCRAPIESAIVELRGFRRHVGLQKIPVLTTAV